MKQVLYILLDNAIKYSAADVEIRCGYLQEKAYIKVVDQGIGIPASDLPYIFDRFYRVDKARSRKTGGTGLGLSIAKELVEAQHGEIRVKSEEERGTTFVILVPASQ